MSVGAALLGGPREDRAWGFCNGASVLESINQFLLNAVPLWSWLPKALCGLSQSVCPRPRQPAWMRCQRVLKRAVKNKTEAGSTVFVKLDPAAPDHAWDCLQRAGLLVSSPVLWDCASLPTRARLPAANQEQRSPQTEWKGWQ